MRVHDPINPLCINARLGLCIPVSSQQRPHTPVTVGGQVGDQSPKLGDQRHVVQNRHLALVDPLSGALRFDRKIRARHTQDFTNVRVKHRPSGR